MPSWAWVVTYNGRNAGAAYSFQCPLGLELLLPDNCRKSSSLYSFNALSGLSCYLQLMWSTIQQACFNALSGLSCYDGRNKRERTEQKVSMPSRAWVVTARMSNILNFSWCFLCIPAIYRCILAYLPIFFNQLSKFLRCESPSTFLGTCLSHHSFIWW